MKRFKHSTGTGHFGHSLFFGVTGLITQSISSPTVLAIGHQRWP